jgi:hydrogenase expression/formation protein HypD
MKYIDEFRDKKKIGELAQKICDITPTRRITLMEVCGTHTQAFFRYGLKSILPQNIRLLSGPGCPVCVSPNSFLDKAIAYAQNKDLIIVSFGDMLRVPGSSSSLEKERAKGADIRVVYSTLDALKIAHKFKDKKIIFLGVGFETTTPLVAASILEARQNNLSNYFVLSAHKLIPPAMKELVNTEELKIDGFICPGHVSTIIGSRPYQFIADDYYVPCVIAGFEPLDIMQAIYMLMEQIREERAEVEIQYRRSVKEEGNPKALEMMYDVFEVTNSIWRGLGEILESGLRIKAKFSDFDAEVNIDVEVEPSKEHPDCLCGQILRGIKNPRECSLFSKICTPQNPVGACMVSSEGTCAAYYKYTTNR